MSIKLNQAAAIVKNAISAAEISVPPEDAEKIANSLFVVSMEVERGGNTILRNMALNVTEAHQRRAERIKLMESLLSAYDEEKNNHQAIVGDGGIRDDIAHMMAQRHEKDLNGILRDLESLLELEREITEKFPPYTFPNRRPVTAKNKRAEDIFRILQRNRVNTWDGCGVIAQMMIEAGIEASSHAKLKRSLYDKLSRI